MDRGDGRHRGAALATIPIGLRLTSAGASAVLRRQQQRVAGGAAPFAR
jgi:hypothetical protein